jgi:hypothetical protein
MMNTVTSMHRSNILDSINNIARISGYILKKQIRSQITYRGLAGGLTMKNYHCWRQQSRLTREVTELGGRRTMVKILTSRVKRFLKNLFALSRCRISKAKSSGHPLSRLLVHAGTRDGVGYEGGAIARRGETRRF